MIKIELTEEDAPWVAPDDWPDLSAYEAFHEIAFPYASLILAPPILADRLRRRGDQSAKPRDFECGCPVSAETGRPFCLFARRDCRFAGSGAASVEEAARIVEEITAAAAPESGGGANKWFKMFRLSASQALACDLLNRLARRYLDAPPSEQAAMASEMKKGVERLERRGKGGAGR